MGKEHKDICVFVDPQNDFISGCLGTPEAREAIKTMCIAADCMPFNSVVVTRLNGARAEKHG